MTRRLVSSGTFSSNERLPASMWYTGMCMRLATIAAIPLFVSPRMSTASGLSSVKSAAAFVIVSPSTEPSVEVSTLR